MSIATQITRLNNNIEAMKTTKQQIKDAMNNDFEIIANEQIESYDTLIENGLELYKDCIPSEVTNQATEISVTDAMKYSRNKLQLFGNTEQASYTGKNILEGIELGDINFNTGVISSSTNSWRSLNYIEYDTSFTYYFSINSELSTVTINLRFYNKDYEYIGYSTLKGSGSNFGITKTTSVIDDTPKYFKFRTTLTNISSADEDIMISTSSDTTYEPYVGGVPAPNPDYPQDIHVVTGNNTIGVTGKNLFNINGTVVPGTSPLNKYNNGFILTKASNRTIKFELDTEAPAGTYTISYDTINYVHTGTGNAFFVSLQDAQNNNIVNNVILNDTGATITVPDGFKRLYFFISNSQGDEATITIDNVQLEEGSTATPYKPYYHQDYTVNLGSMELCKIGNYQDYLYKENGNWYIKKLIDKDILTDTDNWAINTSSATYIVYARTKATLLANLTDGYCNYFIVTTKASGITNIGNVIRCGPGTGNMYYVVVQLADYPNLNTLNNWLSWLENHNIVFYGVLRTPTTTQITDTTLISQLDAIYEHLQLTKGINNITVTPGDLAPYIKLSYKNYESNLTNE